MAVCALALEAAGLGNPFKIKLLTLGLKGEQDDTDEEAAVEELSSIIETAEDEDSRFGTGRSLETSLWGTYRAIAEGGAPQLAMRKLADPAEVWSVFADLFRREQPGGPPSGRENAEAVP